MSAENSGQSLAASDLDSLKQRMQQVSRLQIWDDQTPRDALLAELEQVFYRMPFDQLDDLILEQADQTLVAYLSSQLRALELATAAAQVFYRGLFVERGTRLADSLRQKFFRHHSLYSRLRLVNKGWPKVKLSPPQFNLVRALTHSDQLSRPLVFCRDLSEAAEKAGLLQKQAITLEHSLRQKLREFCPAHWQPESEASFGLYVDTLRVLADHACYRQSEALYDCCQRIWQQILDVGRDKQQLPTGACLSAALSLYQLQLRMENYQPLSAIIEALQQRSVVGSMQIPGSLDEQALLQFCLRSCDSGSDESFELQALSESVPQRQRQWQEKFARYQPHLYFYCR